MNFYRVFNLIFSKFSKWNASSPKTETVQILTLIHSYTCFHSGSLHLSSVHFSK